MAHRPANDSPQNIAAPLVAGQDAIADEKSCRTAVVGDHLDGYVLFRVLTMSVAAELFNDTDNVLKDVDVVVGRYFLQYRRNSFQTGARVNRRRRKWLHAAVFLAIELHEHQVPQFQEAVAIANTRGAIWPTSHMLALVD